MEKSRFNAVNDLFKLSNVISESLKLAESLADKSSGSDETDCKDICRNVRYSLKPLPFLLAGIREYVTEHEDKELARKFVELHDDTKRLHDICSKYADLNKAAFRTGVAYLSMEVIRQYFFPEKEQEQVSPEGSDSSPKPMTRTEATDCIDTIRAAIRKCAKDSDGNRGKEMYAMLAKVDKAKIQAVKEYIVNANDKDLAQLFTEYFAEAVHLSMLPQNDDVKAQSAGIKMFHIAMTMGYVKRNVLHESASKAISPCIEEVSSGFTATDTMQGSAFSTTAQVPVLRLYRFLTTFTVQSGPDKGKPLLDGNAVSDRDFLRAVMRADYSTIYGSCVKGKMRCVAILLSKAYFKDWKGYRVSAARSMGLTPESLAKYNVEKTFIAKLKELLPMIK
ncbi:hypothetical protein LI089_01695 [Alistipes communis]|uniref:hypothetical protein n=1 Tax=Alistipes communis TaxID=2585118 RepID=UPI001D0707B8|nr:hypothetical protein [Alistipes communis]MCB6995054.1 hypothetical protein [Alistipes communis]